MDWCEALNGLRDDVKQARAASNVAYGGLREKVEALEHDVRKIKQNRKTESLKARLSKLIDN